MSCLETLRLVSQWSGSIISTVWEKQQQGNDRRSIMLSFPFLTYKHEIYRNVYKRKNIKKWKGVYLQDDLTPQGQEKKKDSRAIYAFAKSKGIDIKMRGNNLIIDSVRYGPDNKLPHDLSIANAKTVKVKDGLAFQGKHANMLHSPTCIIAI